LYALQESQDPSNTELLNLVESHLSPSASTALDALARTTTALNLPTPDSTLIAHTLIAHTATAQSLTNHLAHIEALHSALQAQHAALRQKLAALQNDPAFTTPPHLPRQTVELGRQAKGLRAKVKEAEERVGVLERAAGTGSGSGGGYGHARNRSISSHSRTLSNPMSSYPSSTASHHKAGSSSPFDGGVADAASSAQAIEEMLAQQEALESLRRRVEALEGKVEEFAGLPADREGARKEVGKLEVELDALRRKRDGLFGGLLEGGGRR
jgi:HAUS augmin-like complex subunit 1